MVSAVTRKLAVGCYTKIRKDSSSAYVRDKEKKERFWDRGSNVMKYL